MMSVLRRQVWLKRVIGDLPVIGKRYRNWTLYTHPFDREFGMETSGFRSGEELSRETGLGGQVPYASCSPSVIRRVLAELPEPESFSFVDLGCGKGRPLLVASEFPFRRIVGLELSPSLTLIARKNAEHFARKYPSRTKIEVLETDARALPVEGRVVFFNFHAFHRELFEQILARLEAGLGAQFAEVFFICLNPVLAEVIDRSPGFSRWAAVRHRHESREIGFGFGSEDSVVVWQSVSNAFAPLPGAERPVRVSENAWEGRVVLESDSAR